MRLQRLTGLEREKIVSEYEETLKLIARLKEILASEKALKGVIVDELQEIQKNYGDARRTEIVDEEVEITLEDLIAEEDVVITVTHSGYIKRTNAFLYRSRGCGLTDGSYDVLLATRKGKAIRFAESDVRDMGRTARGVIGIRLGEGDTVVGMSAFAGEGQFLTVTEGGFGKRTGIEEYPRQGRGGSGVINLKVGEKNGHVVNTLHVQEDSTVMLITAQGNLIRLNAEDIRQTQSRAAV